VVRPPPYDPLATEVFQIADRRIKPLAINTARAETSKRRCATMVLWGYADYQAEELVEGMGPSCFPREIVNKPRSIG